MIPRVVDISHHNQGPKDNGNRIDFGAVVNAGVWGVIHKATQGWAYADPSYAGRRQAALDAGLLWGAYHFNTGDRIALQVENFINKAKPEKDTLMVLDFEDYSKSNMTMAGAVEFLRRLEDALGRPGAIYSGNRLKEHIDELSADDRKFICSHRLWLCQYGPLTRVPKGFTAWWLWQFTGDGVGPSPHSIPGIDGGGIDINTFDGTQAQLTATWA